MTKYVWFKIVSVVVIVGILTAICVIEDRLVITSLEKVNDYCYEIEEVVKKNGIENGEVASLVDILEYNWNENENMLCFLVNHKSIEQMAIEIVRLKTYIDEEEPIEFLDSLELIKH